MEATVNTRLLGAHMSISGGVHQAVFHGKRVGCSAIQIFTKNSNQWNAKPLDSGEQALFASAREECGVEVPLAHCAYLINMASPNPEVWKRSYEALRQEVERAGLLDISYLVLHPGSHTGTGAEEGIRRVADAINRIHLGQERKHPAILIECMAGQGSCLGATFEELARMLEPIRDRSRVGICLDTCHLFAAGYDIRTPEGFSAVLEMLDRVIGLSWVKAFHLNDSRRELGSRVDRHAHIGQGQIGLEAFRYLLHDARFRNVPMILETPKGEDDSLDIMNLGVLKSLLKEPATGNSSTPLRKSRLASESA